MSSVAVWALLIAGLFTGGQTARRDTALPEIDAGALPPDAAKQIAPSYLAARREPHNPEVVGHLAIVLHAWEQWEAASDAYGIARKFAPNDYRWWHLSGLLETRRGRHEAAVEFFDRAAALAPKELPVRLRLAEARLETGDLDGSERDFKELAAQGATSPAAQYGLGRISMARGNTTAALEHFQKAVAAYPDFGAAHYGRALAYRRLGRQADADAALARQQQCLPCWPAIADPIAASVADVREDAAAILQRGIALARDGQDGPAIEAHERALAKNPELGHARINLITLYARVGDYAAAEAQYRDLLQRRTLLPEAHSAYAQVLLSQQRRDDAISAFRSTLALTPADAQAWNGLGLALEQSGDIPAASDAYKKAVVHAPAFRVARFNYARTLVATARLADAIAELEKLKAPEDAETPRYVFALSAALVRSGNVERGRAEALAALELAKRYQQFDLAATIQRDLALLR